MASGVVVGHLEPQYHSKKSHGIHVVLSSLWRGGRLPTDLEYGSPRVKGYDENANQRAREDNRGRHKLSSPWEGPYVVVVVRHGYPGSPPTRHMAVPDKWVRPTRRPADL
jgi:hypothetical protein